MEKPLRILWKIIGFGGVFTILLFIFGVVLVNPTHAATTTIIGNGASGSLTNWGRTGLNTHQYAVKWIPTVTASVCSVYMHIGKQSGAATGDVDIFLIEGGATPPDGTLLATAHQANANIGEAETQFDDCSDVTAGTTYWLELYRTAGWSNTSGEQLTGSGGTALSETVLYQCASGSDRCSAGEWSISGSPEIHFTLFGNAIQTEQFSTGDRTFDIPWGAFNITELAERWTPTVDTVVCRIDAGFQKTSGETPLDHTYGDIWEGGNSPRSGTRYASIGVSGLVLPTAPTSTLQSLNYRNSFNACALFKQNVPYYFVIHRDALTAHEEYSQAANTTTIANAQGWTSSLGVWSVTTSHMIVEFYGSTSTDDFDETIPPTGLSTSTETGSFTPPVCPDFGLFSPLCDFTVWLFVPNLPAVGTELTSIKTLLGTKFPFSYVNDLQNVFTTQLTYSASGTSPSLSLDLSMVRTTSSFGTFLPTSKVLFASSTVQTYGSPTVWALLKLLLSIGIYVGTGEMIYFGSLKLFKKDEV